MRNAFLFGGLAVCLLAMSAHAAEKMVDEQMVVPAHGWHMHGFKTTGPTKVTVSVAGLKDTGKGFDVYVMPSDQYEPFEHAVRGERHCEGAMRHGCPQWQFRHFPEFEAMKVNAVSPTADLPAGNYAVVVVNRYNILRQLTVGVRVEATPLEKDPPLKMILKALAENLK